MDTSLVQIYVGYDSQKKRRMNVESEDWLEWYTVKEVTQQEFQRIMDAEFSKLDSILSDYI